MNHYYHEVPGRLRIRNPLLKGKKTLCNKIENSVSCLTGVESVTVNTVTGSIIVHFDPKVVNSRQISDFLSEQGYFDRQKAVTSDQYST